jgi:hypothetical protein
MSLPNRFYECLSAEVAQFISKEAVDSMKIAGYHVKPSWIVKGRADVEAMMPKARRIAAEQSEAWFSVAEKEKTKLKRQVRSAVRRMRK